ncbi:RAMP superfamily protein [Clostridium liquoris]|uniref:RAMP superfamily protein n=1 Tax=Clostridium liquoris TaxID=1289519 RepID=A0A2T0B210_9CLOT|nr:type III-B CRISPR module RAMP protein Cmr6 [Clostridium liquoris]PRR77941.1 RAMP superfamily protein [Clostridium liquoris]
MMNSSNIGYLYYKEYYGNDVIKKLDKEKSNQFEYINRKIIKNSDASFYRYDKFTKDIQDNLYRNKLYFKTTYPGLIIGTGYSHIIKAKEEFKLGLEFDYTTGLPIINGSSVKGLLRSVFYSEKEKVQEELEKEKEKYIKEVLKELKLEEDYVEKIDFKELTYNIFEGRYKEKDGTYKPIPMNERDIFFGATIDIDKTIKEMKQRDRYLLGEDYITPHGDEKEKLKNPNPIKFLKIMPDVVWCFGFDLKDKYDLDSQNTVITEGIKEKLFERIIYDLGIGAKTNVGYGRFDENYHE